MLRLNLETVLLAAGVSLFFHKRHAERDKYRAQLLEYWEYDPPNRSLTVLAIAGQDALIEELKSKGMSDIPRSLALHMIDVAAERNVPLLSLSKASEIQRNPIRAEV